MPPKNKPENFKTLAEQGGSKSASPESSGAEKAAPEPSATPTGADSASESAAPSELEAKMAEKAAQEPERGPHPYKWRIEASAMIPFGFRDPATGEPSKEKIEEHIADCWRADTIPSVAGVLVTRPKE